MRLTTFPSPLPPSSNPHSCCYCRRNRSTSIAASSSNGGDVEQQQEISKSEAKREARLSARRRDSIKLLHPQQHGKGSSMGEFLRHPAGVETLLNTRALQSFVPLLDSHHQPNTFRCTLHPIQFLGFQLTPVLVLRVTPAPTHCTVELLSCRFEGSESIEQQNDLFSAFMRNHITWGGNDEEPSLDIDVSLEVTLAVYTKPFSLLPLSAVEKPGNLLMQGLLDRLVPLLGEQLLRDYRAWLEHQSGAASSSQQQTV